MKRGILELEGNTINFKLFCNYCNYNITEELNNLLLKSVKIIIKKNSEVLFSKSGILRRRNEHIGKNRGYLYSYFVGRKNLEQVLWDLVGEKIEIEIRRTA